MSFSYRGTTFDKRGCYWILPASPFGRFDSNDNTAEAEEDIEVLEGPEVEIVGFGSSESTEDEDDVESDFDKPDAEIPDTDMDEEENQQTGGSASIPLAAVGAEPDNKYYEVEAIIAGPKKRREHLFKVCYKVRWKGYGAEADTWQPIADLANVQDMIEDYKKERAEEAREKRKKGVKRKHPARDDSQEDDGSESSYQPRKRPPSVDSSEDDDPRAYDDVYGTVKDHFWKDLELGRTQNHAPLFACDMYSKVKGCKRAAHAEAVANIQKQQQQLHGKSPPASTSTPPRSSTPKSSSKFYRSRPSRSTPLLSSRSTHRSISASPRSSKLSSATRTRKRSSDPFSARGYMSAKRSRRVREMRSGSQSSEVRRSSVSSVTSETVGIVTTSSPVTPPVMPQASTVPVISLTKTSSSVMSLSAAGDMDQQRVAATGAKNHVAKNDSDTEEDRDNVFPETEVDSKMVVSSETMLTVTTETKRLSSLDDDVIRPEEIFSLKTDENFLPAPTGVNVGASGSDAIAGPSHDASGATSSGGIPGPSGVNIGPSDKRSTLDGQSEASGAVERSHDEECLWNGACNRSDCKSNRRRNMKKGHSRAGGGKASNTTNEGSNNEEDHGTESSGENESGETESESHSGGGNVGQHEEKNEEKTSSETISSSTFDRSNLSLNLLSSSTSSPSPQSSHSKCSTSLSTHQPSSEAWKSGSKEAGSSKQPSSSHSRSSGHTRRSLFSSSQADSSDSSFEEGSSVGAPLSREAVSNSFGRMDALAHRLHMDTIASSTSNRATYAGSSGGNVSVGSTGTRRSNVDVERPGLFSDDNSAFNFSRQDSGFSGGSTTGDYSLSSPSGSINIGSPGKENFGSLSTRTSGPLSTTGYNRQVGQMDMDLPDSRTDTVTSHGGQSMSSQSRLFVEPAEGRAARKRANDVSQPLEKIPSPNSRDSDLDRRISTLTCDELEDFVEQGEERYGHKDGGFVTNADLLQAVNLSKAEVVKRAINQSTRTEQKLDFEQPDNTGLTLLMRAVQKGNVAVVEMLLEHGVNVNAQQTNGTTALMLAAEQNSMCLVALLLKHGANSSLYTVHCDQAETALMKAIKRQNRDVVNLMLRVGVNIAAPTCTSMSALDVAVERRNPQIEGIVRSHYQRLDQAFRSRVMSTLEATAELMEPLFPIQCFPLRESHEFVVKFNSNIHPVAPGEGFLLFIAHTKITDKGVRCRFHGGCPIGSVTLNGVAQSPLTKEVNFVTSCHPIIPGCNTLVIQKLADYTSKAKLVVQAFRAKLLPC